jgi:hypothetical protein
MLRKTASTKVPDSPMDSSAARETILRAATVDEKLDQVLEHLARMDRRDHWRTIGGLIRATLMLIPTIVFLWSLWYFYMYGPQLIKSFTAQYGTLYMQQVQKYVNGLK